MKESIFFNNNNQDNIINTQNKNFDNKYDVSNNNIEKYNFESPQAEIEYLRNKIKEKEYAMRNMPRQVSQEAHALSTIKEHKESNIEQVTKDKQQFLSDVQKVLDNIGHKDENNKIVHLSEVMFDRGVKFVFEVLSRLKDKRLEDNFHRFLIKYLLSGFDYLKETDFNKKEWKALHLKLYEITPREDDDADKNKRDVRANISITEQLFAILQSIANDPENSADNYYSLEIGLSNHGSDVVFYIAVPEETSSLLLKTIQGLFPTFDITEKFDDYNIFSSNGASVGSVAKMKEYNILPIKTYKNTEGDPIMVIINSFTRLKNIGEGASIQILVRPAGDTFKKSFGEVLDNMRKGDTYKKALDRRGGFSRLWIELKEAINNKDDNETNKSKSYKEDDYNRLIGEKLSSTILDTNIRVFASADNYERAKFILNDIKSAFSQYTEVAGNSIDWIDQNGDDFLTTSKNYIFRMWNSDESIPLNFSELATLWHLPNYVKDLNQVRVSRMSKAPAPIDMAEDGVIIGVNDFKGFTKEIHFDKEDRMRHFYAIGQTGTGKTSILKSMIVQDIKNGDGCCFIDPHGSDIEDILANIPPERFDDVIYFDPSNLSRPMGLNMLEYDINRPEQKTLIVNELLGIFNKLYDMKSSGGPAFEQYFRNCALLVMDDPDSGNTLMEIARVLQDSDFRKMKLSKSHNQLVKQFFKSAEATSGEQGFENYVPYITNKFDNFLQNDFMRPIIAQEKSAFDIGQIMNEKKIFLVNLSKGRLGDLNSSLIGLILVGKFQQAALARVDIAKENRNDFYLYIDEFQNVTTPAISSILSEARKYRLSLNMAHQYIKQLPEDIKDAVFGNVGSMATFRVSSDDAKYLESQFNPPFTSSDIMKIENLNFYIKMLSKSVPQKPFSAKLIFAPRGNPEQIEDLKNISYIKYGRDRQEVEDEIAAKYNAVNNKTSINNINNIDNSFVSDNNINSKIDDIDDDFDFEALFGDDKDDKSVEDILKKSEDILSKNTNNI